MRKFKKLSKAKQKQLKEKLWHSAKEMTKNVSWIIYLALVVVDIVLMVFGKGESK